MAFIAFFALFCHFVHSDATRCFDCQNIPYPRDCASVRTCNTHELCYTEQVVTTSGHIEYNTGCLDKARCATTSGLLIGKRSANIKERSSGDISTCTECCSGDYCNNQGCGTHNAPPDKRGPYCFNCDSVLDPKACSNVAVCAVDQKCLLYSPPEFSGLPEAVYRSQCMNTAACGVLSQAVSNYRCPPTCCDTDFCNDKCGTPLNNIMSTPLPQPAVQVTTQQPVVATSQGCNYKGRLYQQGQTWQDGCSYNCICENGATGFYRCTDRCPSYGTLPPVCILVKKPGQCCSKPQCNFQTSGGGTSSACQDAIPNCADYTASVCTDASYAAWVTKNCQRFCNKCSATGVMIGGSTGGMAGSGSCRDAISNCKSYDPSACTSAKYKQWVTDHCAGTCNLCSSLRTAGTMTGGTVTGTGGTISGTGVMTGTGTGTGCVYKSHLYRQGQTWKDGCKFSCHCVDGSLGKYQCSELCLQWQLPSQCHMSPPKPGKCCQTPSCPVGINIQYPHGYIEQ